LEDQARRGVDVVGFGDARRAEASDESNRSGSTIGFGATFASIDADAEGERAFPIVGESETEVKSGRGSVTSPTVRALIGKKAGDSVEVDTLGGGKSYEILKVGYI
jgi:transcription elongation factor GreA